MSMSCRDGEGTSNFREWPRWGARGISPQHISFNPNTQHLLHVGADSDEAKKRKELTMVTGNFRRTLWHRAGWLGLMAVAVAAGWSQSARAGTVAITSSSDPALSGAVVEGFNNLADGFYSSLHVNGMTISPIRVQSTFTGLYNTTGAHYVDNNEGSINSITVSFDSAVSAFGFNVGATDASGNLTVTLNLGGSGQVAIPITGGGNSGTFIGLRTNDGSSSILSATITSSSGDWVLYDNFTYV